MQSRPARKNGSAVERDTTTIVKQAPAPASTDTATLLEPPTQTTTVIQAPAPNGGSSGAGGSQSISEGLTYRTCDQNVSASQDASCPLAENVFCELWEQSNAETLANTNHNVSAYSPASRQTFTFDCEADGETVTCVSDSDPSDAVTFPNSAIYEYTQADANAYASSHAVG
jgi:hypothetical protein